LFHNYNVFGSRIIHILYTGCAKIKKKSGAKKLINISPPFRMEVAVSETCLYAVGGVRNIDKFYEVYINLITNESPFDSWQLAYHKCQITLYVAPQSKRATAGPLVSWRLTYDSRATRLAHVSSLLSRGLATPYLAGNGSSNGPFCPSHQNLYQ
jgi:hypothetical protein